MKKKLVIFAVIVLTLFNLTALTTVAYHRWSARSLPWGPRDGEPGMRGLGRLGVTGEQMSRMQESRNAFFERTEPLEVQLHQLRSQLFELMITEAPDTLAIFELIDTIGSAQSRLQKEAIVNMMNEGQIFTPSQRRGFFEMFKKHMDEKWNRRRCLGCPMADNMPFRGGTWREDSGQAHGHLKI